MQITTQLHIQMVLFVLVAIVACVSWGYRAKREQTDFRAARQLGLGMGAIWVVYNIYYFLPAAFQWERSLPIHVCDLLGPIAALAIGFSYQPARALLYFCGIALAGQAIATPTGNQDPTSFRFWVYWSLHAGIIALSLFDLLVMRYRPTWKDLRFVIGADLVYAAVIIPINIAFGWNYGYLGNSTPDRPTVVDLLGPWPQRIPVMLGLVIALQLVLYFPWLAAPERKPSPARLP